MPIVISFRKSIGRRFALCAGVLRTAYASFVLDALEQARIVLLGAGTGRYFDG